VTLLNIHDLYVYSALYSLFQCDKWQNNRVKDANFIKYEINSIQKAA